ncbi:hypothetical protein WMF18_01635 [Sorangium sp. So ce315]|uniref:hypothetical protein n=1 Tax=Sorangium sp. So ce315 TaxID=3133299 RepID=UPI003F61E7FD
MPHHGLREIERNPYTAIYHDPTQQLVALKRSSRHYPSIDVLEQNFERIEQALGFVSKQRSVLLVDARDAPLRNDDTFDDAFSRGHARLTQGFKRSAVILKSAIGVLQVGRLSKGYVRPVSTFTRPEDALLHLGVQLDLKQLAGW